MGHYKTEAIYFHVKKMDTEILTFGNIEIEKSKFYHHKTLSFLGDVNTEKLLVSNKISFGGNTITTLLVTCIMVIKLSH